MEVFSLILVVSVCWTRTWKAAIADSIIHIGKGVLRLLVLLDTFPALLCYLPSLGRLFPLPPHPQLAFIACSLAFFCCFVPSCNCFPPGPQASSFSPTALCKGFLVVGYVRALDLEVLMRLMMGGPRARALPRFVPAAPHLQPASRLPRLTLGPGRPHTSPCSSHHCDSHAQPPPPTLFLPSHPPSRFPLPRRNRWFGNVSASPAEGRAGAGGSSRPAPPSPPAPGAPPGATAPGKGSGLPGAPGTGGSSGDAGARRCPHSPPAVPSLSPLSRVIPGKSRARLPSGARFPRLARAARPPAPAGDARGGRGAELGRESRRRGEARRALPPRPLAHLQAPHAGGAGAGGRRRAAPGKVHSGAGSRRGFGEGPGAVPAPAEGQLCCSPRGWL